MANILDYIKWRGDLTLEQSEFNEIDNLILSEVVYFPFEEIMEENEIVSIRELGRRLLKTTIDQTKLLQKEDLELLILMTKSKRFEEMKVTKYINKIEKEEEKQFSAITFLLPDETIYVAYRGTDVSIAGWKEDLNMSFKSHVPSQLDAVSYLQTIAQYYKQPIIVGGHSKGGNLAVYASVFASEEIKKRIINIYNNDGPGFDEDITKTQQYKEIIEKVHTYIPQDSVFGRLLNHEEKYTVVKSSQKGILQHLIYSWQVLGKQFIYLKEVTNGSNFIDKTIKDWLKQTKPKEREQFIDIIFEIINTTEAETFLEIRDKWLTNGKKILTSYKNIKPESKQMILNTIAGIFKIAKDNFFEGRKNEKNN